MKAMSGKERYTFDEEEKTFALGGWENGEITTCLVQYCGIPGQIKTRIELIQKTSSGKKLEEIVLIEFSTLFEIPVRTTVAVDQFHKYLGITFCETGFKVSGQPFTTGRGVVVQMTGTKIEKSWALANVSGSISLALREDHLYAGFNTLDHQSKVIDVKKDQTKLVLSGETNCLTGLVSTPDLVALGQYQGSVSLGSTTLISIGQVSSWICEIDEEPNLQEIMVLGEGQTLGVVGAIANHGQIIISAVAKNLMINEVRFDKTLVGLVGQEGLKWARPYSSASSPRLAPSPRGIYAGVEFKNKLMSGQELLSDGSGVWDYYLEELTSEGKSTSLSETIYCVHPKHSFVGNNLVGVTKHSYQDCYGYFIRLDKI